MATVEASALVCVGACLLQAGAEKEMFSWRVIKIGAGFFFPAEKSEMF